MTATGSRAAGPWRRPLIAISVIVALAGLMVWWLNQEPQAVEFHLACEGVSLPDRLVVHPDRPLHTLELAGYTGTLTRIAHLSVDGDPVRSPPQRLSLEPGANPNPPTARLKPALPQGRASLSLGAGSQLGIGGRADDEAPTLQFSPGATAAAAIVFETEQLSAWFYRYSVAALTPAGGATAPSLQLTVSNEDDLVEASFQANRHPDAPSSMSFLPGSTAITLAPNSPLRFKNGTLEFSGCRSVSLNIGGQDVMGEASGALRALTLQAREVTVARISLELVSVSATEKQWLLLLAGNGSITAAQGDHRNLQRTRLEQILNESPARQSFWALAAAFILFVGGVFLKRALDVLAELLLPGPKN